VYNLLMTKPKSVLFVCLGNIVRSPLAEHLFRKSAKTTPGLEKTEVDSAGTSSYHLGEPPDSRMRRTAAKQGLNYNGRARRVTHEDIESFDLIIAMDQTNYTDLRSMIDSPEGYSKLHLLREFDPEVGHNLAVPDPYYGGEDGFERTFHIVERSVKGLIQAIQDGEL
jgi:protein-tyrosine phosphatase